MATLLYLIIPIFFLLIFALIARPIPSRIPIKGRHVFIYDGSRGIGLAIARQAAAEGARVSLLARNRSRLDDARETIRLATGVGDVPLENALLRQVSSLLRRLPAVESEKFQDDFLMEFNDTLLMTYLAIFTNCTSIMNELIDKFNTTYDRHSRRGGRTSFI